MYYKWKIQSLQSSCYSSTPRVSHVMSQEDKEVENKNKWNITIVLYKIIHGSI